MKIRNLNDCIDQDVPIWINHNDTATYFRNYAEMRSEILGNEIINYITIDSDGIITIEI